MLERSLKDQGNTLITAAMESEKFAAPLVVATWILAFATMGLFLATVALVFVTIGFE